VVSGGTSSGKTTLVNALIREMIEISPQDRLLVMEDTVELQYDTDNKENYTTCDDDDTRITMRDLLKMILRCRPDRIIVGEVRDGAALELLKAWNTGHPGGFATIHADNTLSALNRIESLILEVAQNPMKELIGEAVSVMVHIMDFGRIGRQITEILEVHGFHGGEYQLKHVYRHKGLDSEEIMKKE
jgi:type IV secretion system protein VirB11